MQLLELDLSRPSGSGSIWFHLAKWAKFHLAKWAKSDGRPIQKADFESHKR